MNRRKNVIWANFLVGGLLLATLGACNSDEPAATGTPAPTVAAAPDAAPIAGTTPSPSTSASPGASPTEIKNKDKDKEKPKDNSTASAPKPLPPSKPLEKGEIKEDKPLPPKDIEPKAVADKPKPALIQGGLSESQMKAMKTMLDDAKKDAESGKLDEAIGKYNEFPDGPWKEAAGELKTKAADKHSAIEAAIKIADEASKAKDKAKFSKALTDLLAAVEKAK
jgi:hypothetical protein